MKRNLMDTWLVEHGAKVLVNLGESSVPDITLGDLADAHLDDRLRTIGLGNADTSGSFRLRSAIAASYSGVDPDQVLVTAGVSEALMTVALAHASPGGNVVVPTPAFHALYDVPELVGYGVRKIDLDESDGFRLPLDELLAAIDRRTRLVILNTPHNPTGVVYPAADIARVVEASRAVGATVVVDQHYRFLACGVGAPADVDAIPDATLLGSIGKCLGCTGLRIGWIVAPPALIDRYATLKLLLTHSVSTVSEAIATSIMERRDALLARIEPMIAANAASLTRMVARSGGAFRLLADTAGTTAFLRLPHVADTMGFAEHLLERAGVLVLPGESFDRPGFVRVGLGADCEKFSVACDALLMAARSWTGEYVRHGSTADQPAKWEHTS